MSVKGIILQEFVVYGIYNVSEIVYNLSYDLLFQEEIKFIFEGYECGIFINIGVIVVDIGIFIGCLLKDKYIVCDVII